MAGDPARSGAAAAGDAFAWRFLAPLFMGSALNPINTSIIATALVAIATAVHVPVGRTAALVSGLYLACAVAQPTAGKLAEQFGPRRVFVGGVLTVLAGGVLGGIGQHLPTLVLARVLIGIGTSAGYPSAMLLIRLRADRAGLSAPPGAVLAGLTIASSATLAIGLPLGGLLVDAMGWRAAFLINVPTTLLTLVMTLRWIPPDPPRTHPAGLREVAQRIDAAGIAGFGAALVAMMAFLLSLPAANWPALALALLLGAALVAWELRVTRPFFDVRLLAANLSLTRTYLRFATATLCVYIILYGLTQWLEAVRGMSAQAAGLVILPMSALSMLLARPVSRRNLVRLPLVAAAVACLVGSVGVELLGGGTPTVWIVVLTVVFGIALGTTVSANQTTLYAQTTAGQIGTASGLFRTFGYVGSIASSAVIAIAFRTGVSIPGLHAIGWVMIGVSAAGLVLLLADRQTMRLARA